MAIYNTGTLLTSFPSKIDNFTTKTNASYDHNLRAITGEVIESNLKNRIDNAIYNIESELYHTTTIPVTGVDLRVISATILVTGVTLDTVFSVTLSEDDAAFLNRTSIGNQTVKPSILLFSARPYYFKYAGTALQQAAILAGISEMWSNISTSVSAASGSNPQDFAYWLDSEIPEKVNFCYSPSTEVRNNTHFTHAYASGVGDLAIGHVGNFVVSIVIMAYRDKRIT